MHRRMLGLGVLALATGAVVACSEDLDSNAGCPVLCPQQNVQPRDTVLDTFLALDSTVVGYPVLGTEGRLLVASRGDTLDARAVIRFDTLAQTFARGGADSAIYTVDSSHVMVFLDTAGTKATAPVTVELYDVDTTAADTSTAAVLALFRPDRRIGGGTFEPAELRDTLRVPLENAKVLAKLTMDEEPKRIRLGFRVSSPASAQIRLFSRELGATPQLIYDPSPDTAVRAIVNNATSLTPTDNPTVRADLTDYQLVAVGAATPGAGMLLGVGGFPAQRAYLRFDLPQRLVDSANVLRATLMLTQVGTGSVDATDSLTIFPQVVRAARELGDVLRSAGILNPAGLEMDTLRVLPAEGGQVSIEMVSVLREWQALGPTTLQRAIVLRSAVEGASPQAVFFYSSEAAPEQRPRLRLTFVERVAFGVP